MEFQMDKLIGFFWFIATVTSWVSFGFASWEWADSYDGGIYDSGMLVLMILWFVMSLVLFVVGLRLRKPSS
jgi:hypothetical protein